MIPQRVSIHGGHSGQFCSHAQNTLEEVIQSYIARQFTWVGITEHMPPTDAQFLYPEERQAGLDLEAAQARFARYMVEGRRLQQEYANQLEIFIGFETEAYSGSLAFARDLIERYKPDYVVGGVHHVDNIPFDYSQKEYARAVAQAGDMEALYCRYFDLQYEMIQTLQPKVVAHFDLIRLFDPDYSVHLKLPTVQTRVMRNLQRIRQLNLILDFNVAALRKGASEPYVSRPILEEAGKLSIAMVPGDDSHGADMVGACIDEGIALLIQSGISTAWTKPLA